MADQDGLRWPYGFRFEWALKRVFEYSSGPSNESVEATVRLKPASPPLAEILRNIPDHVGDQLQGTLVSLSQFRESLAHLQISPETRRIVLQRVLSDIAANEREALLSASSWWRQKALENGVGYVDAVIAHYLYLSMTTDLSAQWESSRQQSNLRWEIEEWKKRRLGLLATAAEHINNVDSAHANKAALESYLGRAEVIRDLIIHANEKICATVEATAEKQDTSHEDLIQLLLTNDNNTQSWKSKRLDHCKRIASIVQLSEHCEQNNWSLVTCHVETDDSCGRPKLFRRLLNVVSKIDDDFTRSKAVVRPAIQPFPMFTLSEHKSSDRGRNGLTWERCSSERREFAEQFYTQIKDLKELQSIYGRHARDDFHAPASMSEDLRRKVQLFDYFDEQDDRLINPFSHFRRTTNELVQLLSASGRPSLAEDQQMSISDGNVDIPYEGDGGAEATTKRLPDTPKKLIVHAYQETPLHTPPQTLAIEDTETFGEASTLTQASASAVDVEVEAEVELLRSDLAVLLHALLIARDIAMSDRAEAIAARLLTSKNFNQITVSRLLLNPTFIERYGTEGMAVDKSIPEDPKAARSLVVSLLDDTAVLVEALLAIRGIELSAVVEVAVDELASDLIPEEVAERALKNSRVEAKRRRKRRAEYETELKIKKEIKLEREQEAQAARLEHSDTIDSSSPESQRTPGPTADDDLQISPTATAIARKGSHKRRSRRSARMDA